MVVVLIACMIPSVLLLTSPGPDTPAFIHSGGYQPSSPLYFIWHLSGISSVIAAVGFCLVARQPTRFAPSLTRPILLSTIPSVIAEGLMTIHRHPFDIFFNIAWVLRFTSCLIPLSVLAMHYLREQQKKKDLIQSLQDEIRERIIIQKRLEDREILLVKNMEGLKQNIEELSRSNLEMEQFAYTASHDIKEPLRKIQAFGNLLLNNCASELPTEAGNYLSRMINASERLQTMIDDLLLLSVPGEKDVSLTPVMVNDLIAGILADLEYTIDQKSARFDISANITVSGIPTQIRQLFYNLISNSLKFSKKDIPPFIQIRTEIVSLAPKNTDTAGLAVTKKFYKIEVRDNGIGFDTQKSEKIFNKFERLHPRSEYEGTGLGLALCKKIIENHSGCIVAEGKENDGACFRIYLPV